MDVVMQFAIHGAGFKEEDILIYGWSIGGYSSTWAARNYPQVGIFLGGGCMVVWGEVRCGGWVCVFFFFFFFVFFGYFLVFVGCDFELILFFLFFLFFCVFRLFFVFCWL